MIHGGIIEATGAASCAGNGTSESRSGGSITIYDGTITAKGGSNGAAIGGGRCCSGGSITIYGGTVTADNTDCENGAAIGGGEDGNGGTITICGGTITTYSRDGAGIGGGETKQHGETITVTADTTVTAVWKERPTVIIQSANVDFQGMIQLLFKFSFPADVLSDENAYLTFEKAGKTTTKLVSEGDASGDDVSFTIPVPAPEYADDITVKVYDGEGSQLTLKSSKGTDYTQDGFVYSVRTYAQRMSQDGSTEKMRNLAKALDDYGTAAQIYFTYGDYSSLSVDSAVTAVTPEDLAPYALTTSGRKPQGVTGAGIAAAFDSDNTLRITFKTDGSRPLSDYTFLLDDAEATPTKSGKNARLQVVNIAASNLDMKHTFAVSDGTDTYTVTASALSYAYTSVKNGSTDRQNLGKALYLYNQAANAMFD